jgi:hypothetical protein
LQLERPTRLRRGYGVVNDGFRRGSKIPLKTLKISLVIKAAKEFHPPRP